MQLLAPSGAVVLHVQSLAERLECVAFGSASPPLALLFSGAAAGRSIDPDGGLPASARAIGGNTADHQFAVCGSNPSLLGSSQGSFALSGRVV